MSKYKTREEKELELLIEDLKNTLTEIPYDFVYDDAEEKDKDSTIGIDNVDEDDKDRFRWEDETFE